MTQSLTLTEKQHALLKRHLFPGDGRESAALLVCRFLGSNKDRMIVNKIILVPDEACSRRTPTFIQWPGRWIENAIDQAEPNSDAVLLTHSHPGGTLSFSIVDDESDHTTMYALHSAIESNSFHHGSAIMTQDGRMKARIYNSSLLIEKIDRVMRVGIDITDISRLCDAPVIPFGAEMRAIFKRCTACVIGVSGTGSLIVEMLARKGVGHIILVDFDLIEAKNLNRIVNSTLDDAERRRSKIEMMADAISRFSPTTKVTCINSSVTNRNAIITASSAEILFSSVDSMEGRSIAESISQACVIPLIDLGVTIPTRKDGDGNIQIADICGRIDYVRPDGPSLFDRGVITSQGLRVEYLLSHAPDAADQEIRAGYIKGVHEEAPSVMALNMRAASDAVSEWLARQFGYRHDGNEPYARTMFSLAGGEVDYEPEGSFPLTESQILAQGLIEPLLGLPGLGNTEKRAAP
ncbi:MAG: ThiF family adenylyltransferase [Sneathiella sp.]